MSSLYFQYNTVLPEPTIVPILTRTYNTEDLIQINNAHSLINESNLKEIKATKLAKAKQTILIISICLIVTLLCVAIALITTFGVSKYDI